MKIGRCEFKEDDGDVVRLFFDEDGAVTISSSIDNETVCMLQSTWDRIIGTYGPIGLGPTLTSSVSQEDK